MRKLLYLLGVFFWNKNVFKHYSRLKKSEVLSKEELEMNQVLMMKKILKHAYTNSQFYRDLYDEHGFKIDSFKTLDDLCNIPFVEKKDLLANNKLIQIEKGLGRLIYSETSGSTGESLVFKKTKDWDAATRSAMFRGYSWYGVKPWSFGGYFWGFNFSSPFKTRLLDFLQNRIRLFKYDKNEVISFCKKMKSADYVEGYSSMIYETAKIINEKKIANDFQIKMVKGTSEKIFNHYQDEVKSAFGCKMISEYGSAESGIIAFECRHGNMHVAMENVIVEEVDNEIVVTNLWSFSFPIIRYKLGDYIKLLDNDMCDCGMQHQIIKEVTGRVGKMIMGKHGSYPSLMLYYIFKNLAVNKGLVVRYQAIQVEKGFLQFNIENDLSEDEIKLVISEAKVYFHDDIECSVSIKKIPIVRDGKLKDFISYINE